MQMVINRFRLFLQKSEYFHHFLGVEVVLSPQQLCFGCTVILRLVQSRVLVETVGLVNLECTF